MPRPGFIIIHRLVKELTKDEFYDLKSLEGGTVDTKDHMYPPLESSPHIFIVVLGCCTIQVIISTVGL